ncbi:hypothetical protein FRC08_014065 [Ceratobasidium sp. 394]|nr:hypothetical protein FRC08_014065 [Ceratobasidium sp. 394]
MTWMLRRHAATLLLRLLQASQKCPLGHLRQPPTYLPRTAARQREILVEVEHNRYLGLLNSSKLGTVDLVKYWNIQTTLPLLRAMSKDMLPTQASSVSSERILPPSQLTCTRARNKISAKTIEKLQILKHTLRHSRHTPHARNMDESDSPDDVDSAQTFHIMRRLGDVDRKHDAILDTEQPL